MTRTTDIHALNYGQMQSEVLRKLWVNALEDSNGFPADAAFVKYNRYRVGSKINQAYTDLCFAARAIRTWFVLPLKVGYSQYPVPDGVYDIEQVFLFQSATSYTELPVEELRYIEQRLQPGWMSYPGIPEYAYVGDKAGMTIKLGVAPASNFDATAITLAQRVEMTPGRYSSVDGIVGAAGAQSLPSYYVDSAGADFEALGVIASATIYNVSKGTSGVVVYLTSLNATNDVIVNTITEWSPGDIMRIEAGETASTISIGENEASFILTPVKGSIPQPGITMAANNLLVRGWTLPVQMTSPYQYPELNQYFHHAIVVGATALLGKEEPPESDEFAQAKVYEAEFAARLNELKTFVANQYKVAPRIQSRNR